MIKCFSSSTLLLLQNKHNLSDKSVLGLVCLPFSIAKVWELHRNLDIAILYMVSLKLSAATWLIKTKNVAKDLNYYQYKFQEHHLCLKYFRVTF